MTDKELIKQEIERQFDYYNTVYNMLHPDDLEAHISYAQKELLDRLFQFINSLPEEPASEGLEEEISKWRNHYISVLENNLIIDLRDIEVTANHFSEWQKQKAFQDFLERAEEFLYLQLNNGSIECGNIERLIEQFKNYMQDE